MAQNEQLKSVNLHRAGSNWLQNPMVAGITFRWIAVLLTLFVCAAVTIWALYLYPEYLKVIIPIQALLLLFCVSIIMLLVRRFYREVIKPISSVRRWASRMREGDYSAEINLPIKGQFADLLQELSQMGRWYKEIGREGDDRVSEQVMQMARKTRLLEILYDVAASISLSRDLNEILKRFLRLSLDITHARAGVVRLATQDADMVLVDCVGDLDIEVADRLPINEVIPGKSDRVKSIYVRSPDMQKDFALISNDDQSLECIVVPLLHHGEVMGAYELLLDQSVSSLSYDLHELLTSIGYHLGLAVHKAQLDEEAQQQSILGERLKLAHELHDSLAQTLVSLRFQCKALEDSVAKSDQESAEREILRLRSGVDRANQELRALLAHFRAPVDERGLVPALTDMMSRFREANQILVFSQFHCGEPRPPMHVQRQVLRIVQEALTNISKHADATIVRLLVRSDEEENCRLVLEDDGHGFESEGEQPGGAGEHIGLKIMQERAAHIGADITLESEPGEGTRMELYFQWDATAQL